MTLISASVSYKVPVGNRSKGFTLLELMVVVSIIAILSWLTVVAIPDGQQARIETAAKVFQLQIESHRRTASMKGKMLAVDFLESGYQFLIWDHKSQLWQAFEQASNFQKDIPSGKVELAQPLGLQVEQGLDFGDNRLADRLVQRFEGREDELEAEWQADVLIFPDGRISKFSVLFDSSLSELSVRVAGSAYEKTAVQTLL